MNDQVKGHLACLASYSIFGLNIVLCKDIANSAVLTPYALYLIRTIGAMALFWGTSLFFPKEKVAMPDMIQIGVASFIGMFITQLSFLLAIPQVTAIDTSVLSSVAPIWTMFIAAVVLKEPLTWQKAGGVFLSFSGILLLIFNSVTSSNGVEVSTPWGLFLIFVNGFSFAIYLGVFRPLIARYSVVTFMKWMFTYATLFCLPLGASDLLNTPYAQLGGIVGWEVAYVVLFATFIAYYLIPLGQKFLRPTLVSLYYYVQPIMAVFISITLGLDSLSWQKMLAIVLVFVGVGVVNNSRAKKN